MDRFIGKRLDGRYEISELIGTGGMAIVYKAYDIIDERVVAIKILKEEFLANEQFRRRFKNESKAIAVLSHPNIVKVYDVSFGDLLQYIVMEYISGITLKQYIEQKKVIEWEQAVFFAAQILKALQHAHEKGIVHRDIKPQNIILLKDGSIKVTDFGIARFSRSEQKTITDKAIGSVHYISPEQARGDLTDGKSDIYSVGVLLYEMTTGTLPFQADSAVSVAIMQLQNEPTHPCEINNLIPKGLEQIILTAMQKDASNRYPTAFDMLKDIEEVRRDPYATFDHNYINQPQKKVRIQEDEYVPVRRPVKNDYYEDNEPKSKVIPILASVATVFVLLIVIFVLDFTGTWPYGADGPLSAIGIFSNSSKTVECPNFVGMSYKECKNQYGNSFEFNIEKDYNSEYAKNVIYKQSPEAKSKVKENSRITIYLSLGPNNNIELDDYTRESYEDVKDMLDDLGLKVVKKEDYDEEIPEESVIKTYPEAGTNVAKGDTITVYVSLGVETVDVTVPDVKGYSVDTAKEKIIDAGLKVGDVVYVYDSEKPYGVVVSQTPSSYSIAQTDDSVDLYVSKGAQAIETTTQEVIETTASTKKVKND